MTATVYRCAACGGYVHAGLAGTPCSRNCRRPLIAVFGLHHSRIIAGTASEVRIWEPEARYAEPRDWAVMP